jgi:XTP/dITP diphosphohydrolase
LDGQELFFEGIVEGEILTEKHGADGFGYDPIFRPTGYTESFAQMNLEMKNKISHRARAMRQLVNYLLGD